MWIAALLITASLSLAVLGPFTVVAVEMAWGLLLPFGLAALAGLVHLLRPRTVIDLDTGQVRAGREDLDLRELQAVAFEHSIERFRGQHGASEVVVYSAVLRTGTREHELLRSSDPRSPWMVSRRLAAKLRLRWVLVDGDTTQEVAPDALERSLAVGRAPTDSATPSGVTVVERAGQTRIQLPGLDTTAVFFSALTPGVLGGMGWLTIPPSFIAIRLFVLAVSVAMFLGVLALALGQLRTVIVDEAGISFCPGLGAPVLVPWPSLVSLQVSPKGNPLLVGSGDRLWLGRSAHAGWILSAILARRSERALPRAGSMRRSVSGCPRAPAASRGPRGFA